MFCGEKYPDFSRLAQVLEAGCLSSASPHAPWPMAALANAIRAAIGSVVADPSASLCKAWLLMAMSIQHDLQMAVDTP